ncbi:MAG: glycosyltransferase family 4 protein [Candidatus Didemnitutus sp.]|nr:glycosyltransferase family 4 protein [Candidatus Didemnitutus sp.]
MAETAFSHSQIEAPAPGATLAPGWQILRGWVWPKAGRHFVDVRARIAGRAFPAVHGRPRADLAAHFKTGQRYALAEFWVTVELRPGPIEIVLEALEIEGHWTAFQTVSYQVAGERIDQTTPASPRPLKWHDFTRGLDFILRTRRTQPDATWVQLAARLAADLPVVQDQLFPPEPFVGHADEPAAVNRCRFGLLPVVGYLFHRSEKIARLWCTADLQALQPLKLGRATANLVPHFPDYPIAAACGYEGYVDVPAQLSNPVVLRLYAEMPDGSLHLVQVRTTRRHDAELEKYPYAAASAAAFNEALLAWRSALRVRGHAVEFTPQLDADLARLRASYLAETAAAEAVAHPPPSVPHALRCVLLATHNLNLEGAPLFLLDLARYLASEGLQLSVVSAAEGPLRARFAALGAAVQVIDAAPLFSAADEVAAQSALAALATQCDFAAPDIVIGNTFTTFWAVHAAKAAGRPVLYYVHESTSPAAFYGGGLSPAVLTLVESALTAADVVSFTSDATRRYHAWPGHPVRASLTSGWVDIAAIDAWRAAQDRAALRTQLGASPGELLVTNVGTVCDRKGQLAFARSVALFNQRHPALAARTRFVLLGGRDAPYDHFLRDILAGLALPNLVVHPETPDFLGYYFAADLTVCSSHEESSPRVVFEAMACGTPLLASDIPGISEIARHSVEATLVPPGHTPAWADALAALLSSPETMQRQARAARTRVEAEFAATRVLPRHLALARAVASGQPAAS